jgi:Homing endonuclease associated repeat
MPPRRLDHDLILRILRSADAPPVTELAQRFGCSPQAIYQLRDRKLKERPKRKPRWTRDQILGEIRAFTEWVGRPPYGKEWGTEGLPSYHTVRRLFGSAREAFEAAGVVPTAEEVNNAQPEAALRGHLSSGDQVASGD